MSVTDIPVYLRERLKSFGVDSVADLACYDYRRVFAWFRDRYPSTSYKTLYDLYCLTYGLPIRGFDVSVIKQLREAYKLILPCYAPLPEETITKYLDYALEQTESAIFCDEIPIAAVIVKDDKVISTGYNLSKITGKICMHAEIIALEQAAKYLGTSYLFDCDLYVTIEPCLMCSGAIINSKIKRVVFGALEAKTGTVISQCQVFKNKTLNHHTEAIGPVNTAKYSQPLRYFLQSKR